MWDELFPWQIDALFKASRKKQRHYRNFHAAISGAEISEDTAELSPEEEAEEIAAEHKRLAAFIATRRN